MEPVQNVTRRSWASGLTQKAWTFGSVAQHRYWRRGRCAKVAQDGAELMTLPIRLDRDATEQLLLPSVVTAQANMTSNDRT
jgi:hypothetical protein